MYSKYSNCLTFVLSLAIVSFPDQHELFLSSMEEIDNLSLTGDLKKLSMNALIRRNLAD